MIPNLVTIFQNSTKVSSQNVVGACVTENPKFTSTNSYIFATNVGAF